jgi:hypothetical protein
LAARPPHRSLCVMSRSRSITLLLITCCVAALTAPAASARPPSKYRNWAQTPGNSAGVVFHPYGDYWEVWYNRGGDAPSAVNVSFNYKGSKDRWKTAVQQIVVGRTHFRVRRNVLEHKHIFFRITESQTSPISEYRTT